MEIRLALMRAGARSASGYSRKLAVYTVLVPGAWPFRAVHLVPGAGLEPALFSENGFKATDSCTNTEALCDNAYDLVELCTTIDN